MMLDDASLYQALKTRDARFDGRFFVGVSSTHIYCRPICTVKLPKAQNCTFYPSAAAAEQAGYRPCLRCRPELAPGNATVDATRRLAQAAASLIDDGFLTDGSFGDLAVHLGVTDRHLRRTFQHEFGVAPVEFLQTQRLLLAKRLLTDTRLPITEVAMAAGFGSLRRFNALFHDRYRIKPSDLRKKDRPATDDALRFELSYRPPYAWDELLAFLATRSIPRLESVQDGAYARTVRVEAGGKEHTGWIEVRHDTKKRVLRVALSPSLASVIPRVLGRVKTMFDLACHPEDVETRLGALADTPGLRIPGSFDGFEMALRAILGQQITVSAARTLVQRVAMQFSAPLETPRHDLDLLFPTPAAIAAATPARLGKLGIVRQRVEAMRRIATEVVAGDLMLDQHADVDRTLAALQAIPGIGPWTAQYIAMRALSWPDAFPHTDYAVKKALDDQNPKRILERATAWQPWRAYAVMHLWQSLSAKEST